MVLISVGCTDDAAGEKIKDILIPQIQFLARDSSLQQQLKLSFSAELLDTSTITAVDNALGLIKTKYLSSNHQFRIILIFPHQYIFFTSKICSMGVHRCPDAGHTFQ